MADTESSRSWLAGRAFNYANNTLTIVGVVVTTVTAVTILVFLLAELGGALRNPYAGIIAFLVLPALFVAGLVLIPLGMWRRRRQLLRSGVEGDELGAFPRLDFNDPRLRRIGVMVAALTVANAIILGASSYFGVEHMDSVEFCGTTCHTVMQPEYAAYQESPHSRVACVECHIGPGASWFVRSKVDGLRQVWQTALGSYSRPIETPVTTLRPARETCEQCHWPAKHHGDKLRVFARFGSDEHNTASYTALLLRTGGGSLDLGRHGGIHWWHIYSDNRIRYVAGDERRQEIVWVELVTSAGERRVYTREGEELPPEADLEAQARVMDCIDCHNRPTHLFEPPSKAVDALLENRPELADLPFFKRHAVQAIEGDYPTHGEGVAAVRAALVEYYDQEHPDLASERREQVEVAADLAAEIYGRLVFPQMSTNWETHPNNIGHDDAPGCWRCHDDEMATADSEHVIPQDCEVCHVFLVDGSPDEPRLEEMVGG